MNYLHIDELEKNLPQFWVRFGRALGVEVDRPLLGPYSEHYSGNGIPCDNRVLANPLWEHLVEALPRPVPGGFLDFSSQVH